MLAVRLLLVLLCLCAPASADVVPSPIPSAAPVPPEAHALPLRAIDQVQADMERHAAQLRESWLTLRRTLLGMLSPAQRELIAMTIGQLAIAPDPDLAAATTRIDAALSPAQREAIPRIVAAEAARQHAMVMDMLAQSQRDMGAQVAQQAAQPPPGAASSHPAGATMQAGSAFAMSGSPSLGMVPVQPAGATLLMILMSPGGSPFRPVPMMIQSTAVPPPGSAP